MKPYKPPKWELADASAFQALERGEADEHQQKRALKYLIDKLCETYGLSYRDSDRDTVFAEGKRFVGLEVVTLLNVNINEMRRKDNG